MKPTIEHCLLAITAATYVRLNDDMDDHTYVEQCKLAENIDQERFEEDAQKLCGEASVNEFIIEQSRLVLEYLATVYPKKA